MEALAIAVIPIALLFVGLALVSGRSLDPQSVMRMVTRISWRTLRWLWQDKPQRGGAGRPKQPPRRYRR